jgi:HAD superfamily hydrolase (TIGR01484 family)
VITQGNRSFKGMLRMKKLITFDIDGTLSEPGTAIPPFVAEKLREFENKGIHISLVSGKPAYYLAGLARGMGLSKAKLIGENGCVIFNSATLEETHLAERLPAVEEIQANVLEQFKDQVWIQPNRVALTIFPKRREDVPQLAAIMREMSAPIQKDVIMYEHVDAIDIVPVGVDKGLAIKKLTSELNIQKEDILAFGDSTNDLPMFQIAGKVIIIGGKIEFKNAALFNSIYEAFNSKVVEDFIK